jgi:hypothetical protein
LKSEEAAYASAMFEYRDLWLKNLRRLILAGKLDVQKLSDPKGGIFSLALPLRARLLEIVMRVRNFGIGQVGDELARQEPETT